jgi:hypothetical protein
MAVESELATWGLARKVRARDRNTAAVYVWRAGIAAPEVDMITVTRLNWTEVRRIVSAALRHFPSGNGRPR